MANGGADKNMAVRNKKGIFLTTLTLFLLSLFLLSYSISYMGEKRDATNKRISTMNNFLISMEKDMSRQLYISGYRIVFAWGDEVFKYGKYIKNVSYAAEEAFFNGTVNGVENQFLIEPGTSYTFNSINESLNENAKKIGVEIFMDKPRILISQDDPWNVKITLISEFLMKDKAGLAMWNKTSIISAEIPIENFEDPVFVVNKVPRKIIETNLTFSTLDRNNLSIHFNNKYYINNTHAPSFLDRLQGNLTIESPYGIESFVDLDELSLQEVDLDLTKSIVDYVYFSTENPLPFCAGGGLLPLPSWFKIDSTNGRCALYGLS